MQLRGHSVCVVERRRVQGRAQEWNISRGELAALTRLGLLNEAELETAIASEWVRYTSRMHKIRGIASHRLGLEV